MKFLHALTNAFAMLKNVLTDLKGKRGFFNLLTLAVVVSVISGIILFLIDANVHSIFDGIWSAWVTITHVGFGDVVPTSFFGRLLAALLIMFGIVLFSLITAILSVTLMSKSLDAWGLDVRQIELETSRIESEENQILSELARLHDRMAALEKQLSARVE